MADPVKSSILPPGGGQTTVDGGDVTQGTTTDTSSANTVVGLLKAIKASLAGGIAASRSWVLSSATDSVNVGNFPATQPVSIATMPSTPVTGPLTDTALRATPVPVSGPLTDTALRATPVPVSGPLTDTALRATPVPVSVATIPEHTVDQGAAGAQAWKVDGSAVTQPVSASSLPLPAGAALDATVLATNAHLAAMRSALNDIAFNSILEAERSMFT